MSSALEVVSNDSALGFTDASKFEHIQRVATMFSKSKLVPVSFQNNVSDCIIALEMAHRINASPLMLMQNLHIIHGKPSFGSSFLIASINSSRRFTPLRFEYVGKEGTPERGCFATAKSIADDIDCRGVTVTMEIANKEGWVSKNGSKWRTMPDLMLMYRAATWWCRMYAPETTMGFQTQEEVIDLIDPDVIPDDNTAPRKGRGAKGVSAAVRINPDNTPPAGEPETTDTHAPETPLATEPTTPAAEPKSEPANADTPKQEGGEQPATPEHTKARCELVSVVQKDAKKDGKVVKVCEIQLKGEATGLAFYDGPASAFPSEGSVLDLTLEAKPYRGGNAYVIHDYSIIGG